MAADQEENGHENTKYQEKNAFSHPDHEHLPDPSDNDSDTVSHNDGLSRGDKSRHSDENEAEEHHDPAPAGLQGLDAGLVTPQISATRTRSLSRASSARSRPLIVVPRAERRGLFARFVIIPEVERPYDYSRKTKWLITLVVALAAIGGPIGSNITYRMFVGRMVHGQLVKNYRANLPSQLPWLLLPLTFTLPTLS